MAIARIMSGVLLLAAVGASGCGGGGGGGLPATRLFAAEGEGNVAGNLYEVDPSTGATTMVGPIGFAVTGMAFAADGTLYGITPIGGGVAAAGTPYLIRIDTSTGAGTPVGTLTDSTPADHGLADCTFVGGRLLGLTVPANPIDARKAAEVDVATAAVTSLGGGVVGGGGLAMAADAMGTLYAIGTSGATRTLYTVDPLTGAPTAGPVVTGLMFEAINSATFLDGRLYGVDASWGAALPNDLVRIDPTSGVATRIGSLPPAVDALASTRP